MSGIWTYIVTFRKNDGTTFTDEILAFSEKDCEERARGYASNQFLYGNIFRYVSCERKVK